jgi:nitroreductase
MDVEEAIRGRRSIRKFRPDPVPEGLLRKILDVARWSPSWRNTQAWTVWAVSGDPLHQFKSQFSEKLLGGAPSQPDVDMPGREFPDACMDRTRRLMDERGACELAAGMDCGPEATSARIGDLFGAPCLLVFAIDDCLPPTYACFDSGVLVQTVCLEAHAKGLGTCIMATAVRYPEVLHAVLPKAEGKHMVVCIALGYPDTAAAVNGFARERAELDELVTFVG